MLADCRVGKIDRIITKAISRFARNTVTLLETVRELKALGIAVYFEEQNIDSLSGNGELMLTILASLAQEESRNVSENCKWRIRKDFYEGKPMNLAKLYGYQKASKKLDEKSNDEAAQIIIDETEAQVVRGIFSDYLKGIGTPSIAARLRKEKITCRLGGEWTPTLVMGMLKNEKYTGDSILQKTYKQDHLNKRKCKNNGEIDKYYVEETHPAIISHEIYEAVQARIAQAQEHFSSSPMPAVRYPFTGLIVCDYCGKHYRRRTDVQRPNGRKATEYIWQCGTYLTRGRKECPAKQIPEETLKSLTCEVLGVSEVTSENIRNLQAIRIPCANHVLFVFADGHEELRVWKDRSRAESWTDEMREAARARAEKQKQARQKQSREADK